MEFDYNGMMKADEEVVTPREKNNPSGGPHSHYSSKFHFLYNI